MALQKCCVGYDVPYFFDREGFAVPRALPTQIIGYLTKSFGAPAPFDPGIIQSHVGKVASFLELHDNLSH